jgi:hypothetical protein
VKVMRQYVIAATRRVQKWVCQATQPRYGIADEITRARSYNSRQQHAMCTDAHLPPSRCSRRTRLRSQDHCGAVQHSSCARVRSPCRQARPLRPERNGKRRALLGLSWAGVWSVERGGRFRSPYWKSNYHSAQRAARPRRVRTALPSARPSPHRRGPWRGR